MNSLITEESVAKYKAFPMLYISAHPSFTCVHSSILLSNNVVTNASGQWFIYTEKDGLIVRSQGSTILGFGWTPRRWFLERDRDAIEAFLRQAARPEGSIHDWTASILHSLETMKLVHFFD
ncbi:hypothetical protein NQ176_g6443 [Zarea fungicola]|uniref:Uncharacterized protein n=1 Tax=Zarea fungicola TaxID=93591 RepID=A0ACC1N376_9HYPO|nr:hypothetical protein NQ176_g6443 [Lecanicillium fungicola]